MHRARQGREATDCVRVLPSFKRTLRNVSRTSDTSVRNSDSKESVSGHGIGTESRSLFFNVLPKSIKMRVGKWSLNRPIQARYFFESCSLLDPSKSKVQTASRQKRWGTLHIPLAKINYSPDARTHGRTDIRLSGTHGRKERFAQ